jgi:argininosuccinate lyase
MSDKLWSGRFNLPTDKFVEEFNASIHFDKRFAEVDIKGSIAHVKMLADCKIISKNDADTIIKGLNIIINEINNDKFEYKTEDEDIHMAIEKRLTQIIGKTAGKLHTARSRNDQVALDFRLYLRNEINIIKEYLKILMKVLIEKAKRNQDIIMPGYTHLQSAQPILFAHYLLAYFQMLKRDFLRFSDALDRMNYCPLGAGALAGTTFPINRFQTSTELGFKFPTENSLDSVSDRDFALEILSDASICQMHLSRFSEELIIFSSSEFKFIELSDDYCTGSSIMPQKKNPDIPELIRGKTGRVYGNMISLFVTMKALPLAYNKDMQEDKEPVFDSIDTLKASLKIFAPMIEKMSINKDRTKYGATLGFTTATDLADYLVRKGLPFREAHNVVGKAVAYSIEKGKDISELSINELKNFNKLIENDVYNYITVESCINNRKSFGGTALESVLTQIKSAEAFLSEV